MPLWELTGGLALIIIALAIKCKPRPTFLTMRHESAWIYYMHMYVLMLLSLVIFTNGASKGIIISCAFVISFALAWLLTKLQNEAECSHTLSRDSQLLYKRTTALHSFFEIALGTITY